MELYDGKPRITGGDISVIAKPTKMDHIDYAGMVLDNASLDSSFEVSFVWSNFEKENKFFVKKSYEDLGKIYLKNTIDSERRNLFDPGTADEEIFKDQGKWLFNEAIGGPLWAVNACLSVGGLYVANFTPLQNILETSGDSYQELWGYGDLYKTKPHGSGTGKFPLVY